jgi:hypothetical protein
MQEDSPEQQELKRIKRILDIFDRDGKILMKSKDDLLAKWEETSKPVWNFGLYLYKEVSDLNSD